MKDDITNDADPESGIKGRKRDRTIGKTLQRARDIMYESVNELLRTGKTGEDKLVERERGDQGTGKK